MSKISCIIVEDDSASLTMVEFLANKTGLLDIKATFTSSQAAISWFAENEVDLLFLDVEMPKMSGIEMLRALPNKPDVIIISGKSHYAVEAFDLSVVDYLIKPVTDYSRFLEAVNRVIARRKKKVIHGVADENLFVKVDSLLLKLNTNSILWVEGFGDYIKIVTLEKTHTIYATLKKIEDKLDRKKFVRIHRSYIVNVSKITNIDPNNLEINKTIIPISGTYKEELLKRISVL
jgi:DNA-binding LytR/AlgR family response regulator